MLRFLRDAHSRVDSGARHHEHRHLRDHPGAARRLRRLHPQHDDHPGRRHQRRGRRGRRSSTARQHGLNEPMPCSTSAGSGASSPAATSATASTTTSRSPRWSAERLPRTIALALTCHFLASRLRHRPSASSPRPGNIPGSTPLLSFISFLGMTIPRFLLALIILYILAFKLNVQEIGSFFSSQVRRRALVVGQVRRPRQARLAGDRDRDASAGSPTTCG